MNQRRELRQVDETVNRELNQLDLDQKRDKNRFVESITDRVVDPSIMLSIAQQLGANGGGGLFGGGGNDRSNVANQLLQQLAGGRATPAQTAPQGPQMTPWGPLQQASPTARVFGGPISANPVLADPGNPLSAIFGQANLVNRFAPPPLATGSNRYAQRRSPLEYLLTGLVRSGDTIASQRNARRNNLRNRQNQSRINRPFDPNLFYA